MNSPSDDIGGSSSLSRRDLDELAALFPSLGFSLEEESEEARVLRENAERQAALRALHQRREAMRRYLAWKKSPKKRRLTRGPGLNKVLRVKRPRKGKFRLRRRSRSRKRKSRKRRKRRSKKRRSRKRSR